MGSLKRKIARTRAKQAKKRMAEQLNMFDKLGDECSACDKPYDKKSKEHVSTWNVVVKEKEKIVRLYCPECWEMAHNLIKEIQNDIRIYNEKGSEVSDTSES
jgi:transcription elongation factor Elf1